MFVYHCKPQYYYTLNPHTSEKEILKSVRTTEASPSISVKILAKILLNHLNVHLDQKGLIPENQCGFRKDRGTIDMIFTARQLQEKCQEQNVDLFMTFADLTKAIDKVSRDGQVRLSTQILSNGAAIS